MAKLTIIYWQQIPSQVIGQEGRVRIKRALSARFAIAIDRAAMRAGKGSSEAYLNEWRRENEVCEGELEALVEQKVRYIEEQFPDAVLAELVKAGGAIQKSAASF